MDKVQTTWILVCDASRARLFAATPRRRGYVQVAALDHPASRARALDLQADAPGRKPSGASRGAIAVNGGLRGSPGAEPDTDPKDVEAMKFARELAATLSRGLDDHAFASLVLVAPPRFLGLLRDTLDEQVSRRVVHSVDKDLSQLPPHELVLRLGIAKAA